MIVLDTSALSVVFRRRSRPAPAAPVVARFVELVKRDVPLGVPGVVLQEVLSGVRTEAQRRRLDDLLGGFPLLLATRRTHVRAAEIGNLCRARGIAAGTIDCLIASHALEADAELLTLDADFSRISRHTGLRILPL